MKELEKRKKWLNVNEAGGYLELSPETVRNYAIKGVLVHKQEGKINEKGRFKISRLSLEALKISMMEERELKLEKLKQDVLSKTLENQEKTGETIKKSLAGPLVGKIIKGLYNKSMAVMEKIKLEYKIDKTKEIEKVYENGIREFRENFYDNEKE